MSSRAIFLVKEWEFWMWSIKESDMASLSWFVAA